MLAQSNIEEALNRGDGAALVTLINGTDNTDFSGKESAVRIVLLERLLLLSQTDKDSRTTTAIALLKLFPEDTVIAEIAAAEGTEPPKPDSDDDTASGSETPVTPPAITAALDTTNANELIEQLLRKTPPPLLSHRDRERAINLIVQHVRPLPASMAQENLVAYRALLKLDPENATFSAKVDQYIAALDAKRAALIGRMKKSTDSFNGNVFYKHPKVPRYADTRSYMIPYIGQKEDRVWMRFVVHYTNDSWLFIQSASLNIDGEIVRLPFDDWDRDNDSEIWEWADATVTDSLRDILRRVANSDTTVIRFNGRQYYDNVTVPRKDKEAISDMFLLEEILLEKANAGN